MNNATHVWSLLSGPALVPAPLEGVLGYVGPAGLGALGVLLLVVAVLLIGALGLVLHPIRLILRRRRRLREAQDTATNDAVSPQSLNEIR
jgi:hypothetical protein